MLNLAAGFSQSGYNLTRSLRFRASASAYLSRTNNAAPTDFRKCTFSAWIKRGTLGINARIIDCDVGGNQGLIGFNTSDQISFAIITGSVPTNYLTTNNVFRDPSAWYHIVFTADTSVGSNQFKLYVNGVQASYSVNTTITVGYGIYLNSGSGANNIGRSATYGAYLDGYLAETNFIDGQALTPSSFGSYNSTTGVWQPAPYTGTYGTNGFYLPFTDNSALTTSSNVGLGKDFSGNGNYWTTNNISITSGVTYDSMTDVPTLTSATAANYCVLNPLDAANSIINANLTATNNGSTHLACRGSIQVPSSGLFYIEGTINTTSSGSVLTGLGVATSSAALTSSMASTASIWGLYAGDFKYLCRNGTAATVSGTVTAGSVLQLAVDPANNRAWVGINNVWFDESNGTTGNPSTASNPTFTSLPSGLFVYVQTYFNTQHLNFGQRPFAYTPPTGFVALNAYNLPTSTILKGSTAMNIALDTGANIKTTTEALFTGSQYLEWIKDRANANNNQLMNSVVGLTSVLQSNADGAATTYSAPAGNSVGWAWKAGASSSSNTSGTITSTVSVNASAGFSIVRYTGNGVNGSTVGHGLGVTPEFVVYKIDSASTLWVGYSKALGNTGFISFSRDIGFVTDSTIFNNTSPTSSVLTVGTSAGTNSNTNTYVAYCFAPIAGYSAMGTYSGNGSTDGTFVYTGFRPSYVLKVRTDSNGAWFVNDSARSPYNAVGNILKPNDTSGEDPTQTIDFLSNGFKLRSSNFNVNQSGSTYFYLAFSENPFKNSLAR